MSAKILVVEDNDLIREEVAQTFEKLGYETLRAEDGVKGVEIAKSNEIAMIVTDLNMPRMDGFRMCEEIRKLPQYEETPIVALTSERAANLKEEGKALGIRAWAVKPINPSVLAMLAQRLIKSSAA